MENHTFSQHFAKKPAEELRAQFAASEQRKAAISKDQAFDTIIQNEQDAPQININELTRTTPYQTALNALKNTSILTPQKIHDHKNYLRIVNNLRQYLGPLHLETDVNLRDIQVKILEDLLAHFEKGEMQGYVVAPTGLGKTVIFSTLAKAVGVPALFVVPKQGLVEQTSQEVSRVAPNIETGQVYQYSKEYDKQITITTYASLMTQIKSGKINPLDYGLIVLDEAHAVMGKGIQAALEQFGDTPVVGFTATPQFDTAGQRHIKTVLDTEFYNVGVIEAVEQGYLSGFRCIVVQTQTSLDGVALTKSGDYDQDQLQNAVDNAGRNKAAVDLCQQEPFVNQRGIINCAGINHAEEMARLLCERNPGSAAAIHSNMDPMIVKKLREHHLTGELRILTHSDMINEGYDNRDVEYCVNLRPTRSLVVAAQRGGRTLRLNNNLEKIACIIDFVDKDAKRPPLLYSSVVDGSFALAKKRRSFREYSTEDQNEFNDGKLGDDPQEGNSDTRLSPLNIHIDDVTVITDTQIVLEMGRAAIEGDRKVEKAELYETYEEAKFAALRSGITTSKNYRVLYKKDPKLPLQPDQKYAEKGWISWYEFLGNKKEEPYDTYEEAREAAQRLGITNYTEYLDGYKDDRRLPSSPDQKYENKGWIDWPTFFGREKVEFYETYEEAREAAQRLGVTTQLEYLQKYKDNPRLPSRPNKIYENKGWIDWYAFFGKESREKAEPYETYEEAKAAAQTLGITKSTEYKEKYKDDPRLPSNPSKIYANKGWIDWPTFFGKESREKVELYETYEEAREVAQKLVITGLVDYRLRYKEDSRLSCNPSRTYAKKGWIDWYAFLGKEKAEPYETYEEVSEAAQRLGVTTQLEYLQKCKEDLRLPSNPRKIYAKKGWIDWYAFFGREKVEFYETYEEAKAAVQKLGITGVKEYLLGYKDDPRLPSSPDRKYANKGWIDWPTFLGTKR